MTDSELKSRPSSAGEAATVLSAAVLVANIITDVAEPAWLTGIGLLCLCFAVVFAVPPFSVLTKYGAPKKGDAYYATTRVVDRGVYSVVRHPQYLGYALMVVGFTCLDPHWIAISLAIGASTLFYVQAVFEERFCREDLGAAYGDYQKRVPRFNFVLGLFRLVKKRSK